MMDYFEDRPILRRYYVPVVVTLTLIATLVDLFRR